MRQYILIIYKVTKIRASLWENRLFAYAKTKTQISSAVTEKLISAFVFAIQIVQSLYYLNTKFQAFSHLLWLYSPVCVGPGQKPECCFSHNEAHFSNRPAGWLANSEDATSPIIAISSTQGNFTPLTTKPSGTAAENKTLKSLFII